MESPQEEQQMNVYLGIIRTVAVKVNASGTIKDLKSLFRKKEGVSENLQDIFYNGQPLKDENKLVDHGIQRNSTLNLYPRGDSTKLFVSMPADDTTTVRRIIAIEPTICDTVKNMKYLVQAKEDIEIDTYTLFYIGKQLEDDMTLGSVDIPRESTLYLVFTPRDSLSVSVELPCKEVLKLEVKYMHRIRNLKAMILSKGTLLLKGEDLYYEGKRLNDLDTVASCDIKPNSTLQVLKNFKIFVKDLNGRTHTFYVNQRDTGLDLKKLILNKLGITPDYCRWRLLHCSRDLEDGKNLASHNMGEHSIVHLLVRIGACKC